MRLTLRTLLAWLDGVLPPDDQKRLGDRVAGSTVASHIVERIRAAVARSVLPAPRITAKGLADDPNSVAEYLDNSLPSDRLEPFERVCIESEVHLAEVAACHGILAAVSREPSHNRLLPASDTSRLQERVQRRLVWERERPVELAGHDAQAIADRERALRESRETARALRAALGGGAAAESVAADDHGGRSAGDLGPSTGFAGTAAARPVESGIPSASGGSRKSSTAAWLSAGLAAALLVALGGLLGWSLLSGGSRGGSRQVAARESSPAVAPPIGAADAAAPDPAAEPAAGRPTEQPAGDGETTPADSRRPAEPDTTAAAALAAPPTPAPVVAAAESPPPAAAAGGDKPAATITGVTPPVGPVPAAGTPAGDDGGKGTMGPTPPAASPAGPVPQATAVTPPAGTAAPTPAGSEPATPAAVPTAAPGNALAPQAVPTERFDDIGFVGAEGVLLRRAAGAGEWTFMPPNSPLRSREDLLVPPGCHPELNVAGVTVRLMPQTLASVSVDQDGTPRFTVAFGQLVARAGRADARLGITAAGLSGTIEAGLAEPVAVQVELTRFPGTRPGDGESRVRAEIIAASRGIVWRQAAADGTPPAQPLEGIGPQGMLPAGTALEWDSAAPGRATVAREPALPAWVNAGPRTDRLEKSAREALAAKLAGTTPVTRALRELALDKRVENRMAAAATLALLGEFDEVAELLCAEAPAKRLEPRQWAALEGSTVPLALAIGGPTAAALRQALEVRGPNGKAEALWSMACGASDAQIFAGEDRALVERLEDPSLVVRRYAHKCLVDIVQPSAADRLRYRADAPADLRREGVTWWRNQAEKGLIRRAGGTAQKSPADGFADQVDAGQ